MNLLLLSSSREGNTDYLSHALSMIDEHLGATRTLLFIPYAGVTIHYDDYTAMVANALAPLNIKVTGIHEHSNANQAVRDAQAIAVGGGNTFHLLNELYQEDLLDDLRAKVSQGMPYIGWSAGSNVAGLSIRTTNDMPIIQPPSFNALNFLPFQINPHYTDYQPPGHNGETRQMRLEEFMVVDKKTPIVGIQEGSALKRIEHKLCVLGEKEAYLFQAGKKETLPPNADLSHLISEE